MKKLFISIIVVILGFNLSAQDTIKVQSLPKPGFTYIVPNDTVTTYVISAGSANAQIWDYSNLIENYSKVPTYDSTSKTAYASSFPTSNIFTYGPAAYYSGFFGSAPVASQGYSNGFMFWRADSTGFWVEGFRPDNGGGPQHETHITPHELLIPLPGYYNFDTTTHSTWTISIDLDASNIDTFYVSNIYKDFKYDAFGTLTTPIATYNNVIRLHDYSIKVDSVYAKMGSTVVYSMELSRNSTHTYYYLDKNTDYPVMTTYADINNNVQYTEYYKTKYPYSYNLGVQVLSNAGIELYPNPTQGSVTISKLINDGNVKNIHIINAEGKTIKTISTEKESVSFSTESIKTGIYFVKVMQQGSQETVKLVIE